MLPADLKQIKRVSEILDAEGVLLPSLVRDECTDLLQQIAEKTAQIDERAQKIRLLAKRSEQAKRLQTMPGVGKITALAIRAFTPHMGAPH